MCTKKTYLADKYSSICRKILRIFFIPLLFLFFTFCDVVDNNKKYDPPIIDPIGGMPSPYQDVSISLDGQKLIFFRTKYTYVSKDGINIQYDPDSTGIWICNIDGSEMKIIYKNNRDFIGRPQFIPNSNYILFNLNNQIVKAAYNGNLIDSSDIVFLTSAGKNFFPSVNEVGDLIVFDSNNNDPNHSYNIWSMDVSGNNKRLNTRGRMPYIKTDTIYYVGLYYELYSYNLVTRVNNKESAFDLLYNDGITLPMVNNENNKIIFLANGKIGIFNLLDGTYDIFSTIVTQSAIWNKNGKIIYVVLTGYKKDNGTIWIMNEDGSDKKQITFNHGLILEGGE